MVTKSKKTIDKANAVDAEIVSQSTVTEVKASDAQSVIQTAVNELTKQHTEKGTLAFEFLKSLISGKAPLSYDEGVLTKLTLTAFQLADLFKQEMDVRWSAAIADVVNKFQDPQTTETSENQVLQ